jgi:hypothetical protein
MLCKEDFMCAVVTVRLVLHAVPILGLFIYNILRRVKTIKYLLT